MAATSSTRRRRRASTNRNAAPSQGDVQVSFPRALANRVVNYFREGESLREAIANRIYATAIGEVRSVQSAARSLGLNLGFETNTPAPRRQNNRRPTTRARTTTQTAAGASQPTQRRATRSTRGRSRAGRANNGRTEIVESVRRNLPAVGSTMTLAALAELVGRDLNRNVRTQDIGQAINKLPNGTVNRIGRDTIETLRRAA